MAEFSMDQIISQMPSLISEPESLKKFIAKGNLIYSTLTKKSLKEFFIQCVKSNIIGSAIMGIDSLNCWDLIKKRLMFHILPAPKSISKLLNELLKTIQFSNESIQNFYDRINVITNELNLAYKSANSQASFSNLEFLYSLNKKTALEIFIKGLKSQTMKICLKAKAFTEFSEALIFAKQEETDINENFKSNNILHISKGKKSRNSKSLNKPVYKCNLCFRSGHLSNYCRYTTKGFINPEISKSNKFINACFQTIPIANSGMSRVNSESDRQTCHQLNNEKTQLYNTPDKCFAHNSNAFVDCKNWNTNDARLNISHSTSNLYDLNSHDLFKIKILPTTNLPVITLYNPSKINQNTINHSNYFDKILNLKNFTQLFVPIQNVIGLFKPIEHINQNKMINHHSQVGIKMKSNQKIHLRPRHRNMA